MRESRRLLTAALLVAAWLGAALVTVAVVAPGAFAVLPSRTVAGAMVGRVLPSLFVGGIAVGVAVAALMGSPFARRSGGGAPAGAPVGALRGAWFTALLASLACAISQFAITPRLDRLRAEIGGPVDALSPADPRRVAFGLFHGYNVAGLGVAMFGAGVCLAFLVFAMRPRS
jgi:Domain of unknown function (DUF4149)